MQLRYYNSQNTLSNVELSSGSRASALADLLNLRAPHQALTVSINDKIVDLSTELQENDTLRFFSFDDPEGKEVFWHTTAHVLAQAILRLHPHAKPTIGPPIENGFYYDFANLTISEEDLLLIEKEMQAICEENFKSERHLFSTKEELLSRFKDNKYKREIIETVPVGDLLSGYSQGEFFDFCRGPHLASLGKIKAIKVTKTSGAYWRADAKNEMLTRIYGISFPDRKLLKEYLQRLEEAKKRDHKILGPKLGLFSLHEEAPGIPFIHPKGMIVWNRLLEYWRAVHYRDNYVEIKTPTMMVKDLWVQSGHWQNYRENMFTSFVEEREFAIKPMNCPGGMLYYNEKNHSYRELPMRVAEIGQVHRFEPSGSLSGLFRVRSFHQDDAHIFMKMTDIQSEILALLGLIHEMYTTFGLTYELALSTRPESQTIGTDEDWATATEGLRAALIANKMPFEVHVGEGAFYGPKIDLRIHDALGRKWQCGTIQLDMALPERFHLEYTADDGTRKRPIILHRTIYGSIERFFGSLIEFYAGRFPLWLSPSQVRVVPVASRHNDYAYALMKQLTQEGYIADVDDSNESVSKKIRDAQLAQYNYILTIGDQELEKSTISLRTRDGIQHPDLIISTFLETVGKERAAKALVSPYSKTS